MKKQKNDWALLQETFKEEMGNFKMGQRVQLNFLGFPKGEIMEIEKPIGLLAPRYKCKWDTGEKSGWLSALKLRLI